MKLHYIGSFHVAVKPVEWIGLIIIKKIVNIKMGSSILLFTAAGKW